MRVAFAGYGPGQKLLYALYRRRRLPVSVQMGLFLSFTRWYLYLGGKVLTSTAGFFPVHAPGVKRIFFIESGDDDTVRSTDEAGGDGSVVARFEGGLIRALAVTQNRSRAAGERVQSGDELIVSVHYPQEGQSAVYTGIGSGKATAFKKRFSTPGDWVMVAGTGAFGGGTRIVFNLGYNLRVWDNRDGSMNEIRQWKRVDDTHSVHEPIPGFRHYVWGSGLALSPNVEPK
jgi:hypothetical protein